MSEDHSHQEKMFSATTTHGQRVSFLELEHLKRIGSRSGGTVYLVNHRPTGRLYALKVVYDNSEEAVLHRIQSEINILRNIDHPNVVCCHEAYYTDNGKIQVLLEYMEGGSLEGAHIADEAELSRLSHQVLRGLAYLHGSNIVHRGIKPSNLLVNSRGQVKIGDFGVSRVFSQTMGLRNFSAGTFAYWSPERINTDLIQGLSDSYAGDIWSVGLSILELYLGRFPFHAGWQGDWATLMWTICMSDPPSAPDSVSQEFRDFIACCLQREPTHRWTATQLLEHPFIIKHS